MIVVGCTTVAYKMTGDPMAWGAWLANAEKVQASTDDDVRYFAALEVDARGLEPFTPLLARLAEVGGEYWTFSFDDKAPVITSQNRLARIVMGHNIVGTYAIEAGASHVFFLASDTSCRDDALPRLLELDVAAAACHISTYCLDGPGVPIETHIAKGWPTTEIVNDHHDVVAHARNWDVRMHMETCAAMLLRRDVVRQIKWRYDPDAGLTDDPSMHRDLKEFLGEEVYSRHDVMAVHWPETLPGIEGRHTVEQRTVVRA